MLVNNDKAKHRSTVPWCRDRVSRHACFFWKKTDKMYPRSQNWGFLLDCDREWIFSAGIGVCVLGRRDVRRWDDGGQKAKCAYLKNFDCWWDSNNTFFVYIYSFRWYARWNCRRQLRYAGIVVLSALLPSHVRISCPNVVPASTWQSEYCVITRID